MRCNNSRAPITDEQTKAFAQTVATAQDLRDKIAELRRLLPAAAQLLLLGATLFRHPVCAALRSIFDALDGIDALTDQLGDVAGSIAKLDALQPKLLALIPPQIANQQTNRDLTLTNYATNIGHQRADARRHCRTRPPSARPTTRRRPTTPSTSRRRRSPTPNS